MNAHTRTGGPDSSPLGLTSVLVGSLPAALMTDDAPDRYTVEAVFTRRPEREEIVELLGGRTRAFLAQAGYPTAEVTISDRRLQIANTNLEELRDGLATVLADRLAEVSAGVRAQHEAEISRSLIAAESEHQRVAAVAILADSVSFVTSEERSEDQSGSAKTYRARVDAWTNEGGHVE